MRVERLTLPAAGILRLVDATGEGEDAALLPPADGEFAIAFEGDPRFPPAPLVRLGRRNAIVLDHPAPHPDEVAGNDVAVETIEAAARAALAGAAAAGRIDSLDRRFHPRRFAIAAFPASGDALLRVYRRPAATRTGQGGGLALTLAWSDGAPAAFALVQATHQPGAGPLLRFRAQADEQGDAVLDLGTLPPAGGAPLLVTLSARGDPAASAQSPPDPDALPTRNLRRGTAGAFAATLAIADFPHGRLHRLRDAQNRPQPVQLERP